MYNADSLHIDGNGSVVMKGGVCSAGSWSVAEEPGASSGRLRPTFTPAHSFHHLRCGHVQHHTQFVRRLSTV